MAEATMGTHSGTFQADEALGIFLLRQLPKYQGASLKRSRDKDTLAALDIVIDVAGLYDHNKLRYDHHQRGFFETFDGANEACCDGGRPDVTAPETATGTFKTKLSASGLVYKHYGREVLCVLHANLRSSPESLEWAYNKMYVDFMEAIDGNDNGVEIADKMRYKENTTLPDRVHRLNARWNAVAGGPSEDELFEKASALCGTEFSEMLSYIVECELPARDIVEAALKERADVHPSGRVIRLPNSGCPWKTHLYELERKLSLDLVQFVLFADTAGMWRVQAVTEEGTEFTNRLGLLEPWRGVRDAELTAKTGIEGCKFVHAAGFIGGNATYEGALAMALKTIEASKWQQAPAEPSTPDKEGANEPLCFTPPAVLPSSKLSRHSAAELCESKDAEHAPTLDPPPLMTMTTDDAAAKVRHKLGLAGSPLILLDFDDTFMENLQTAWKKGREDWNELLQQRGTVLWDLKARYKQGLRIGFVTNRPLNGEGYGIMDLVVALLPTEIRDGLILSIGGGAEVWKLGKDGKLPDYPTQCVKPISEADRMKMQEFMRAAATPLGISTDMKEVPRGFESDDFLENNSISYEYCVVLYEPKREKLGELYACFEEQFNGAGLQKTHALLKKDLPYPSDPYIRVRVNGAAKGAGVSAILDLLGAEGVRETSTLYIGDEFGGEINGKPRSQDDTNVAEVLPECMAIDVGPSISPSSPKNVYHIGGGPEKTMDFLKAL